MGCFCAKEQEPPKKVESKGAAQRLILGKYKMSMDKADIMGEGTSSICRKGTNTETGEAVAIKTYKDQSAKKI